jgi:DNA-binding response OmpR family regulator/S1-C subfamily serine protease
MEADPPKIVIVECEPEDRDRLEKAIANAGYAAHSCTSVTEGIALAQQHGADLLILNADLAGEGCREALVELRDSAAARGIRVIALVGASASERALGLNLGADDVLSRPWQEDELLARVRAQLRTKREEDELRARTQTAQEEEQIARAATETLAATEKMTRDVMRLGRGMKIGAGAVLAAALGIAAIVLFYSGRTQKQTQQAYALVAQLEKRLASQQDLLHEAEKLHGELAPAPSPEAKQTLQKQAHHLRAQIAEADPNQVTALQQELAKTNARLEQVERETEAAQTVIREDVGSVCLLHVSVAFRDGKAGQRLHYAGLNAQGEPLLDSNGNTKLIPNGEGPEARLDILGTGFLVGADGEAVTNRHVAEPWWQDEAMTKLLAQGVRAEVAEMAAYFPDEPGAYPAAVLKISPQADLAVVHISLGNLRRRPLSIDGRKAAAIPGQGVISVGYATGIAAILARADRHTVEEILNRSNDDPDRVLGELARRNLIYPLITQGHIGEVTPDRIVFDAETTFGGSGGPLFNPEGKVVGVTYGILSGFGGSNFGVPIRYVSSLLAR